MERLSIDIDGDSTMHSSPELNEEDEMFPDEAAGDAAGPSTPRHLGSFPGIGPSSELSPPNSQGPLPRDDNSSATFSGSPSALNANGKRVYGTIPTSSSGAAVESSILHEDKETGYQWSKQEEQPGWEWKNTRAKEEEMRALDQIIDKGSMIKSKSASAVPFHITETKKVKLDTAILSM